MTDPMISVSGLSKVFDLHKRRRRLGMSAQHIVALAPLWRNVIRRGRPRRPFHSLSNVSFDVARSEILGVIGRNGAGKSTLLKILARVLDPSAGTITLQGRVASLIELGAGFTGDLTVDENVELQLALSGEAGNAALKDQIIELAELTDYRDVELDDCPGGSPIRLSFATVISINSDIVLADEILAIGNAAFKQLCIERIRKVRDQGGAVLFVSHDMEAIRELCDRVMWLERGEIHRIGATADVVDAYEHEVLERAQIAHEDLTEGEVCRIVDLRLVNKRGAQIGAMTSDSPAFVECIIAHLRPDIPVKLSAQIWLRKRVPLLSCTMPGKVVGGDARSLRVRMTIPRQFLAEGAYNVQLKAQWRGPAGVAGTTIQRLDFKVFDPGDDAEVESRKFATRRPLITPDLPWRFRMKEKSGKVESHE